MKNKYSTATLIRWAARITAVLSLAIILVLVLVPLYGNGGPGIGFEYPTEIFSILMFPVSTFIGLLLAWKWEGIGGVIIMGSAIGFFVLNPNSEVILYIMALTGPGLLFLIYWFLHQGQSDTNTA